MSGGVDSSVAAALMIERGYTCIGCTMKLLQGEEFSPADKTDSDRTDTAVKAASDTADGGCPQRRAEAGDALLCL